MSVADSGPKLNARPSETERPGSGALRHRNYRLFYFGQIISVTGTWMQMVAQSWLVYRLSGSELLLGTIAFCAQIPVLLFSIPGGLIADRYSRHRILITTQTLAMVLAALLATLTLSGRVQVVHVALLALCLGAINAIDVPTRQAFVLDMVDREALANAIALNSTIVNTARILGPSAAGILVSLFGEGACFLVNAFSYLAVLFSLLAMRGLPERRPKPHHGIRAEVEEALHFAVGEPPVRQLLFQVAITSITGVSYVTLMPIFADQILHGGPSAMGILNSATGVGALIASGALVRRARVSGLESALVGAGIVFGLALIAFSQSTSLWLSIVLLMPVGAGLMTQLASTNTLLQAMVPDDLRGRVMSLYSMMFIGMAPIGALVAGALASRIGAKWTVSLGGIVSMLGALYCAVRLPALRSRIAELVAK